MGLTREEAYWNSELILLDYCIWQNLDNQAKETLIEGVQIGMDQIYDAHEVELKTKDWRSFGLLFSFPFLVIRSFLVGITSICLS